MAKKMRMPDDKAYVLLSGGQDSFVCALWAKDKFKALEAISIAYNQSHKIELDYAKKIAAHFSIEHTIYDIGDFFSHIASSSLLNDGNHIYRQVLYPTVTVFFLQ
jgi:7-cyano-7-deazaguanine synthase